MTPRTMVACAAVAAFACFPACQEELSDAQRADLARRLGCQAGTRAERRPFWYGLATGCVDADGDWHGPFEAFWDKGNKKAEGAFHRGRKHGRWRIWLRSGQIKEHGPFVHGRQEGDWTFHENGRKISEGQYQADSKHGRWVYFDSIGRKIAEGTFRREEKTGPWITWDAQGRRCQGEMVRGRKTGRWTCYHGPEPKARWAEGDYLDGKEHGPWTVWHENGRIKRAGEYRMGQRAGTWLDSGEAGEKIGEYEYSDGHMVRGERTRP